MENAICVPVSGEIRSLSCSEQTDLWLKDIYPQAEIGNVLDIFCIGSSTCFMGNLLFDSHCLEIEGAIRSSNNILYAVDLAFTPEIAEIKTIAAVGGNAHSGLCKSFLENLVHFSRQNELQSITLDALLDGGWYWAKRGFVPANDDVMQRTKKQLLGRAAALMQCRPEAFVLNGCDMAANLIEQINTIDKKPNAFRALAERDDIVLPGRYFHSNPMRGRIGEILFGGLMWAGRLDIA